MPNFCLIDIWHKDIVSIFWNHLWNLHNEAQDGAQNFVYVAFDLKLLFLLSKMNTCTWQSKTCGHVVPTNLIQCHLTKRQVPYSLKLTLKISFAQKFAPLSPDRKKISSLSYMITCGLNWHPTFSPISIYLKQQKSCSLKWL